MAMVIDDMINMQPARPPKVTDDLAEVEEPPSRLAILGKTRNIERLRDFPLVEALWIGDVNERQFHEILPLIDPLYLFFDGLRVADLAPLGRLQRLQALEIQWNTKVASIAFLKNLVGLRLFALSHCPKVHDLGPIAELRNLEILDLSGGMWSTFRPDTLEPLRYLKNLRGLSLTAIRVGDQSLRPIAGLTNLQEIELSNQFPTEEYARLSVALPHIQCTHFSPYLDFGAGEDAKQVMVTGKGKPVLSLPREADRLQRYVERFREMQEQYRTDPTAE